MFKGCQKIFLTIGLMCSIGLSACSSQSGESVGSVEKNDLAQIDSYQCSRNRVTTFKDALIAERIKPGDTHYIEFRMRHSPVLPTGHLYVVYGKLNAQGKPVTFHYTGLYPKGAVAGLYTGIIIPISLPANTTPSVLDCNVRPSAAYRRSISSKQYKALLGKVKYYQNHPPKWRMLSYNCNHYAASLGRIVGLKAPAGKQNLQFLSSIYIDQLVKANGDKIIRK